MTVRVDQHLVLRPAPPDSHEQDLQDDIRRLTALHRPADHAPGMQIHDDRKVSKALLRPDLGDVGHPDLVRGLDIKLPVEGVIDHDRRLAAITAWAVLIADLRWSSFTGN